MPWKYAALISYNGTQFCGWQKQRGSAATGRPSIQETIEIALQEVIQEKVSVVGSGRTDAGVHSIGQTAHFLVREKEWNPENIRMGLNSKLRPKIQVVEVKPVSLEFHAQRSAVKKQYSYYFQQGSCSLPHLEPFSWWIKKRLDLEAMKEAVSYLVGEHDFKAFQSTGATPGPTVRTIFEAEVFFEAFPIPQGFGFVRMRLVGSGFLKHMVRGIAGTLLEVGERRREPASLKEILLNGNRADIGATAPSRALWLEKVWYPKEFAFPSRFE